MKEITEITNVKSVRDLVHEYLRKAILTGEVKSGEKIVEREFAAKMKISRTPIREALRMLEIEGFVEYVPRKGVFAKSFDVKDVEEIYAIREAMETLIIKQAIKNIAKNEIETLRRHTREMQQADAAGDRENVLLACQQFNMVIASAAKMPRVSSIINNLQDYLRQFRKVIFSQGARRSVAIREHQAILEAVIEKDEAKALTLTQEHLARSKASLLERIQDEEG